MAEPSRRVPPCSCPCSPAEPSGARPGPSNGPGRGTLRFVGSPTIQELIARALTAYADLAEVAGSVEEEWSYVDDLRTAWVARLDAVAGARADEGADPAVVDAVEALSTEVAAISDPHRAIDWLSTFPQVALLALGEST